MKKELLDKKNEILESALQSLINGTGTGESTKIAMEYIRMLEEEVDKLENELDRFYS